MHFDTLPRSAELIFRGRNVFQASLSDEDRAEIELIYGEIRPHFVKPQIDSSLYFDRAIFKLCKKYLCIAENSSQKFCGLGRDTERMELAIEFYRTHIGRGLDVNRLCKAIHISPPQMRRIFKNACNKSPSEVLSQIAIEEACRLMLETRLSLKEIASKCGFAGFPQFFRAFRKQYNSGANEWRKRHRKEI